MGAPVRPHVPTVMPSDRAVSACVVDGVVGGVAGGGATGNLWDLTERLHVDLERTASSACRP